MNADEDRRKKEKLTIKEEEEGKRRGKERKKKKGRGNSRQFYLSSETENDYLAFHCIVLKQKSFS